MLLKDAKDFESNNTYTFENQDLTIQGDLIPDIAIIVINGNITINGDVKNCSTILTLYDTTTTTLLFEQNIKPIKVFNVHINGNIFMNCNIIATGSISLNNIGDNNKFIASKEIILNGYEGKNNNLSANVITRKKTCERTI